MNPVFSQARKNCLAARHVCADALILASLVIFGVASLSVATSAQVSADPAADFKRISAELSAARLGGGEESAAQMEKALAYLDSVAVSALNVATDPNLDNANRGLEELASHTTPVGENYRLVKLGGAPASYALIVNFGLGGPAAVRIYAGGPGHYALAAKIDRYAQKDFFDSDVELVPVSDSDSVFVTVSGRTDDLSTGMFSAWEFDGHRILSLWNSDLLQQSSYAADETGFHLAYCSQVDDDHPSECLKMSRDLYRFQSGAWKRAETVDLPSNPPAK